MVTDEQVKLLRRKRMEGKTQEAAAAASGMSVRSARKWQKGPLPSETKKEPRSRPTRKDPFEGLWEEEIVPLLRADTARKLQATAVFADLERRHPGRFKGGEYRTLQRRFSKWRGLHGPEKEGCFEQEHPPGREAAFDFTHGTKLQVSIAGAVFAHLIFALRLSFSRWTWVSLASGETYEAMVTGIQDALWALGGVPLVIRHDNLSAATHEIRRSAGRSLNRRFSDFLAHYDLTSTRIRPGKSNENGGVEKGHDLVKTALEQELQLRGSREFDSVESYRTFVLDVVDRDINNAKVHDRLAVERSALRPLPPDKVPTYTVFEPTVRKWSTIRVAKRSYSVPSRLIGHKVRVHQHADVLEVFFKGVLVETLPRLHGEQTTRIDYRHIAWSLARKPGAFARYKHREQLFPTINFRVAYDGLVKWRGDRADVEYVRILHLAAATMESQVDTALEILLEVGDRFAYADVKELVEPDPIARPQVAIASPDLTVYDGLLAGGGR